MGRVGFAVLLIVAGVHGRASGASWQDLVPGASRPAVRADLAAAGRLLAIRTPSWDAGLAAMDAADTRAAGPPARTVARPALGPADAMRRLAMRHGADAAAAAAAVAALPDRTRSATGAIVAAFLDYEDAARATYRPIARDDVARALHTGRAAREVDLRDLLAARRDLVAAVAANRTLLAPSGFLCAPVRVPPAIALDLDGCSLTYTEDFALVIDVGGTDVYTNNAGGASLDAGACTFPRASAAALFDLGDGDDRYGEPDAPRGCGVNGGGFYGPGLLVDQGGNDRYAGERSGINGGTYPYGTGLLLDLGGDDEYVAVGRGANGGGRFGAGALIDLAGDDVYRSIEGGGVNGGGGDVGGNGFLFDASGDDRYVAAATSGPTRDASNGGGGPEGRGFLLDAAGNDLYDGGSGAANGGAETGLGFLLDASGDDVYLAGSFGVNGGALSNGAGHLVDLAGHDVYTADSIGSNGGGAGGAGFLLDRSGDDRYVAGGGGANGGGFTGAGALIDLGGADSYEDGEGGTGADATVVPKGAVGAQVDA